MPTPSLLWETAKKVEMTAEEFVFDTKPHLEKSWNQDFEPIRPDIEPHCFSFCIEKGPRGQSPGASCPGCLPGGFVIDRRPVTSEVAGSLVRLYSQSVADAIDEPVEDRLLQGQRVDIGIRRIPCGLDQAASFSSPAISPAVSWFGRCRRPFLSSLPERFRGRIRNTGTTCPAVGSRSRRRHSRCCMLCRNRL